MIRVQRKSVGNFSSNAPCAVLGAGFPRKTPPGTAAGAWSPIVLRYTRTRFNNLNMKKLCYTLAALNGEHFFGKWF